MDAAALRARLVVAPRPPSVGPAPVASAEAGAIMPPVGGDEVQDLPRDAARPAAVLVPFVLGAVPGVLLTKRAAHLSTHAGQVCFPGGRIDAGDLSAEAAALREAQEEIGIDPAQVELLGRLPDYVTGTGFCITPVVGLLPPGVALGALALRLSAAEVESVFELPLSVLLDPAAPQRRRAELRGRWREFWVWPHPEHYIWGATAGILVNLAARLREAA